MYNRYIPQPDGSFTRRLQPDKTTPETKAPPESTPAKPLPGKSSSAPKQGIGFLRQLLPKDFDTGDLIVILLLLLMAGDCQEDRSNAILTIALYLLM